MRKILMILLAILTWAVIHEGFHALLAAAFGEYEAFYVRPYGLEVVYRTPVPERAGFQWALIAGVSNVVTVLIGYALLGPVTRAGTSARPLLRDWGYWVTLFLLFADPLNISVGPFIYGGDAVGIAVGLSIPLGIIQAIFFVLFLVNRELVAAKLLPAFGIETKHPLFRRWVL